MIRRPYMVDDRCQGLTRHRVRYRFHGTGLYDLVLEEAESLDLLTQPDPSCPAPGPSPIYPPIYPVPPQGPSQIALARARRDRAPHLEDPVIPPGWEQLLPSGNRPTARPRKPLPPHRAAANDAGSLMQAGTKQRRSHFCLCSRSNGMFALATEEPVPLGLPGGPRGQKTPDFGVLSAGTTGETHRGKSRLFGVPSKAL